jgi:hypothetical protein
MAPVYRHSFTVMAGLDPAIHVGGQSAGVASDHSGGGSAWMPGSSPGMTDYKS